MSFMDRTMRVVQVAPPAAATDWSVTVPGGRVWVPLALTALLTTDANAGNRDVSLRVTDQTNIVAAFDAFANQGASLAELYSFVAGAGTGAGGTTHLTCTTPIPDMALPAGYVLETHTTGFEVGDQWSSIVVWVEEVDAQPFGVHEWRRAMREAFLLGGSLAAESES